MLKFFGKIAVFLIAFFVTFAITFAVKVNAAELSKAEAIEVARQAQLMLRGYSCETANYTGNVCKEFEELKTEVIKTLEIFLNAVSSLDSELIAGELYIEISNKQYNALEAADNLARFEERQANTATFWHRLLELPKVG